MKKITSVFLAVLLCLFMPGCGDNAKDNSQGYHLYYLTEEENKILEADYTPEVEETNSMIAELTALQSIQPVKENCINLLPSEVTIESHSLDEGILTLDMNKAFLDMNNSRVVLAKAGLVRTFLQIPGVKGLLILVDGERLKDSDGHSVGVLRQRDFVETFGEEVNDYKSDTLTLYFTDMGGNHLVSETRKVYHSTNTPVERVVLEQLIKGPKGEGHYATLSSDTNLLNVTTQDGICYVSFDDSFQTSGALLTVAPEISIYSIVNSLVDTCGISKVQFSVNGDTNVVYKDAMELEQLYEVNKSFVN